MDACETRRDAALIALLLEGALKPGEVRAANVGDVSFLEGCAVMVVKPSASRPESVMRLPKAAASKLERYLEERKPRSSDEPLFTSESTRSFGTRLADRSIREVVKAIFSRAGIPGTAGDYDLRKTALLLARDVGAKDEDLVRFARLRSMSTVKDADNLYRYASDGPQELLSRALASGNPGERACVAEAREVKQLLEAYDDDTLLLVTISETGELTVSPFETAAGC